MTAPAGSGVNPHVLCRKACRQGDLGYAWKSAGPGTGLLSGHTEDEMNGCSLHVHISLSPHTHCHIGHIWNSIAVWECHPPPQQLGTSCQVALRFAGAIKHRPVQTTTMPELQQATLPLKRTRWGHCRSHGQPHLQHIVAGITVRSPIWYSSVCWGSTSNSRIRKSKPMNGC